MELASVNDQVRPAGRPTGVVRVLVGVGGVVLRGLVEGATADADGGRADGVDAGAVVEARVGLGVGGDGTEDGKETGGGVEMFGTVTVWELSLGVLGTDGAGVGRRASPVNAQDVTSNADAATMASFAARLTAHPPVRCRP